MVERSTVDGVSEHTNISRIFFVDVYEMMTVPMNAVAFNHPRL